MLLLQIQTECLDTFPCICAAEKALHLRASLLRDQTKKTKKYQQKWTFPANGCGLLPTVKGQHCFFTLFYFS